MVARSTAGIQALSTVERVEVLFVQGELDSALRATVQKLLEDVQGRDPDQLLTQSENEVAAYLTEKYSVHCPE